MRLGCDPEIFLKDAEGNPVSAIGKFGGTKDKPLQIEKFDKGCCIQEDNVLVEYNIPPALTINSWITYNLIMLKEIKRRANKLGLDLLITSSAVMPEKELEDPRAWVFGCDPDYNAWTKKKNPKPVCENPHLRSAGGHIHLEFEGTKLEKIHLVRLLDKHVGKWIKELDPDKERQKLYGDFGAFRYKKYGVEYRTPSNFWLSSSDLIAEIWVRTQTAVLDFNRGVRLNDLREIFE